MIQAMIETGRLEDVQATYQRFGELIVRGCAMLANEHVEESEGVHFGVGRAIEQHFGVEE
jgi:tartrate dehydratase beta subunit/fumarate hydratase class I family protein